MTETSFTPREIVSELDRYIVGQTDAKRAVAIALRNRWRRQQLDDTMREALQAMRERWHEDERVEDLRLAAYMIAIQKIALTYQSKSLG